MKTSVNNKPGITGKITGKGCALSFFILLAGLFNSPECGAQGVRDADRPGDYYNSSAAAQAATEKVIAQLSQDCLLNGEAGLSNNLAYYSTLVPNVADNPYWTNYSFFQPTNGDPGTWVGKLTNSQYVILSGQYEGLLAFRSTYRIASNARSTNGTVTAAVWQDVAVESIPIFEFEVFYNDLLEFTWSATLFMSGQVHANHNIYVGSSSDISFSDLVTCSGVITNPAWDGHTQGQFSGNVNYFGMPVPGYATGEPVLTLPVGTNNLAATLREIINLPSDGEDPDSAVGQQRYYNKAGMVILVADTNITITIKNSPTDPSPLFFTNSFNDYTNAGFSSFIATNALFYDQRDQRMMKTTQIDVGKFKNWLASTNFNVGSISTKFISAPLNIIYVDDLRNTNSMTNTAIRLMNGQSLPDNGLTVATVNPLYVWGHYNCPSNAFLGTTNTMVSVPASVVADALTVLSPNWSDALAANSSSTLGSRNFAVNTTINTAIIAGIVYSTTANSIGYSGGVMNLPRLLENWSTSTLTLNTSLINFYNSVRVTKQFVNPGTYYLAPLTRHFSLDQNFLNPAKLPPGTPQVLLVERLRRVAADPNADPSQ